MANKPTPKKIRLAKVVRKLDRDKPSDLIDTRRLTTRVEELALLAITPEAREKLQRRPLVQALLKLVAAARDLE